MASKRIIAWLTVVNVAVGAAFVSADEGMWLVNKPPTKLLKEKYGFEPAPAWLERVQKSSIRFESGGSASLVSANGLVMTNHHVGSDDLEKFSTPEKNLLKTGFYAKSRDEELKCEDLEVNILWSIEDVTDRVNSAVTAGMSTADANTARRKMIATIEKEAEDKTKLNCQVVTLYQGGRYHLYSYKQFTDIRLVFAPEQQIAFFGGDTDNFEYPRFDLDVAFFRIYDNGQPLKPEHYLKWSEKGASDGDLTFVSGHPWRTQRQYTVDHLTFLRDVDYPNSLRRLWRREVELYTFRARNDEYERIASGDFFGVQNSRKARTGILAGLLDPEIFRAKIEAEKKLRAAVDANPDYKDKWSDAWDQIAMAQKVYREFHARRAALERIDDRIGSQLFGIAKDLVRLAEELPKPSPERLREYRDSELDSVELKLFSPAPIYPALEIDRLASSLSYMAEELGGDDPLVVKALAGSSPRARAAALVHGTRLMDIETRRKIKEGGSEAISSSTDAMIRFALDLDPSSRALRKRYEDEVEGAERDGYAKIAAANFAINGEDQYPDATFTLRMSFGPVKGYAEEGKQVAPFTTYAGLYQRFEERKGVPPFDLPQRWLDRKDKLNLDVPLNFVCTADIIGGNSGSPVINKVGEVVGLIFDGNIQSLVWNIAYTDKEARAVCVDTRGIIEALRSVYDAGALADEIVGKASK